MTVPATSFGMMVEISSTNSGRPVVAGSVGAKSARPQRKSCTFFRSSFPGPPLTSINILNNEWLKHKTSCCFLKNGAGARSPARERPYYISSG
jgi:hypothetical protein